MARHGQSDAQTSIETKKASGTAASAGMLAGVELKRLIASDERSAPDLQRPEGKRWPLITLCVVWGLALLSGFLLLFAYKGTSTDLGYAAPSKFPAESSLLAAADKPTLLMFIHPRCACSRASLAELERVLLRVGEAAKTYVVVHSDTDVMIDTDITQKAAHLPNVVMVADAAGREAARFLASTSGHTLLYSAQGNLVFSGGLTNTRGHEGPSFGQEHLLSALSAQVSARKHAEIFGCSLKEKESVSL